MTAKLSSAWLYHLSKVADKYVQCLSNYQIILAKTIMISGIRKNKKMMLKLLVILVMPSKMMKVIPMYKFLLSKYQW